MNEEEIIDNCTDIAEFGHNEYEFEKQRLSVKGLLDLYNKAKYQLEKGVEYNKALKEENRKLQNKLEIEKKKSYKLQYYEEVSYVQSKILNKIKAYPVEFKDDRLILLVDKTLINNGMYETNFVSKEDVKNKLDNLIEKLEKANLGGFVDETRDIKEELLEEENE